MKRIATWMCVFAMILATSFALAAPAAAQTQITTGVIQGTVTDQSGALVPGADVEAKNLDTNLTRTATTDTDGRFIFLSLPPGRYTVKISKSGFATIMQENVTLTVGQAVSLYPAMKVSAAAEVITVTDTPTVELTKTEGSSTLNEKTISQTPVLGRKFEDLLTLTPGVSIVQGPDGDEITFNGQRGTFTNVSLDGGDYINGFFGEQVGGQRAAIDIPIGAIKEFQVVATGANAEFGRTAAGVINVITKSGTNAWHGDIFAYFRHENLSSKTSNGESLTDFHREQYGASIGGPIVADRAFIFATIERVTGNLQRANLSQQIGATACPQSTFVLGVGTPTADEALLTSNSDCQRIALLNFMQTSLGMNDGLPVRRPIFTTSPFVKFDANVNDANRLNVSYNFNASKKVNETFDVPTYGNSANGIEGNYTKIHVFNVNWFTTFSPTLLNEAHFTYSREARPRSAVSSPLEADTGVGFAPSFRFGNPFFLQPGIDELFWRTQIKDSVSWVRGAHTIKFGGEWLHSLNDQVFRGFFTGRYLFDSTVGFLRYASAAAPGGFGPDALQCANGMWVTENNPGGTSCATVGSTPVLFGPLALYLQGAGLTGPATDAAGASKIDNEEYALFVQDKWQIMSNFTLNLGLRWEAQIFPHTIVDPSQTAYGPLIGQSIFPGDGTLHSDKKMWQPRVGFAWDIMSNQKSVLRWNAGIYNARQNMLTQVQSITTNGVQQTTLVSGWFVPGGLGLRPTWPNLLSPPAVVTPCVGPFGTSAVNCGSGIRTFHKDYRNPRIYTTNVAYEQEIAPDWALYTDFTWSKGVYLTRFIDLNRADLGSPFAPYLGEAMFTTSFGQSLYRGWTLGVRKRFSDRYQLEANYVLAGDYDDDSNERDPFTDRFLDPTTPRADYGFSDRDIRHKFNFYMHAELPWQIEFTPRVQARSAQPFPGNPRLIGATVRNNMRKDNKFFSFDWALQRPFRFGERFELIPSIEMFNTFNNDNNVISDLNSGTPTTAGLFNFDGFLRQGVGDPRQVQLALKFKF